MNLAVVAVLFGVAGHAVEPPPVVTRSEWGARPPVLEMRPHRPTRLTIHHSGVASNPNRGLEDKLRGLQAFSQREDRLASGRTKPAWADIPYHWYIGVDGRIGEARDPRFAGDTNTEYDPTGHLSIVLEGNFDVEEPTAAQIRSLWRLSEYLALRHQIEPSFIAGHLDYAATACPGKNLIGEVRKIARRVELRRKAGGTLTAR